MMKPFELIVTALLFAVLATCNPLFNYPVKRFSYGGDLAKSYDFVIIGGGQAGLVLASRLSEDSNTTVLVIEAGDSGEAVQDKISIPSSTYFNSLTKSEYDWSYDTTAQTNLGGRTVTWPRGKVLGGSSAINGMYAVRPSEVEVNAWSGLQDGDASSWSWSEYFKAMEKSETFTKPSDDIANEAKILSNDQDLGASGPIHTGFPGFTYPTVGDWSTSLSSAGVPLNGNPYAGKTSGGFVARSFIDPSTWQRSYSRSAYIDPLSNRPNLSILVKNTVTRIIFASADNHTATGVEFAESRDGDKHTVGVNREVILSAGTVGSPQVLMLSGVGPKDVLSDSNIPVQLELPGVGQHLQDHLSLLVIYKTDKDTSAKLRQEGMNTPEFNSFVNSAVAYLNTSFLFSEDANAATLQQQVQSQFSASLIPSSSSEVLEGAKAIYDVRTSKILTSDVGQIELLLGVMFADTISIGVGLQQPLSQGRLYIRSSSAFDYPVIDPNYLSHPADKTILRQGVKVARMLSKIAPLSDSLGDEVSPGPSVVTDEDIEKWLAGQVSTEYHPSSSCAMLPQSKGGVVDANLKVHGLNNVRVVDASVFPFVFTAHLGGPVYGLAEQAANIIRAQYNSPAPANINSSSPSNNSNSNPKNSHSKNGAISHVARSSFWTPIILVLAISLCM